MRIYTEHIKLVCIIIPTIMYDFEDKTLCIAWLFWMINIQLNKNKLCQKN